MSNRTILFADDSATMRTIMEKTFFAEPFDVVVVPSGEAAIMKARDLHPDIIIADSGMAGVSGYDLCKAVRTDQALKDIPFIIMSGVSNPYDESKGAEVGVSEHVKKPFDTAQLVAKVHDLALEPVLEATLPIETEEPILMSKPLITPPSPSPVVIPLSSRPIKDTAEFGFPIKRPMSKPPAPEPLEIEPEHIMVSVEPLADDMEEVEPIELSQEVLPDSFHVGTLAEMAQMGETGEQLTPEEPEDAIELIVSPVSKPLPTATSPLSSLVEKTVSERIQIASKEIEEKVDGLTKEQIAAIAALTHEVVERVVWEIVPDLAETIIKEELTRLLKE